MRILGLLILVVVASSCGGGSGAGSEESATTITAEAIPVLAGTGTDPDWMLVDPNSIVLDDADNVFVRDVGPTRLLMFGPDGAPRRRFGRPGEGPGELNNPGMVARAGRLLVHDPPLARLTLWDTAGNLLWVQQGPCCRSFPPQIDIEGSIYAAEAPVVISGAIGTYRVVRHSPDGTPLDTLEVPAPGAGPSGTWVHVGREMAAAVAIPFAPQTHVQITRSGTVLHGHSSDYRIVESRGLADTVRVLTRAWIPVAIPDSVRRDAVEALAIGYRLYGTEAVARSFMKLEEVPTHYPSFLDLKVDSCGRWWVARTPSPPSTGTSFDVFDSRGTFVSSVTVAEASDIWAASRGRLAMVVEGPDGTARLSLYRLSPASLGCMT